MTEDIGRWVRQSAMSDPAGRAGCFTGLPSSAGALNTLVQGLLIHAEWLAHYGLGHIALDAAARTTWPVADRLADILARDALPLTEARPPARRAIGTCRDFALLLCAIRRHLGVPARLRCGFAAYLGPGWEDHWVCEVWDREAARWRLCDPQVDAVLKALHGADFDTTDLPSQAFMTAGQAWIALRQGRCAPEQVGKGRFKGPWFVKINVIRDHFAVNHQEASAWDGWRRAEPSERIVAADEVTWLDDLAAHPTQRLSDLMPDWRS